MTKLWTKEHEAIRADLGEQELELRVRQLPEYRQWDVLVSVNLPLTREQAHGLAEFSKMFGDDVRLNGHGIVREVEPDDKKWQVCEDERVRRNQDKLRTLSPPE